MFFSAIKSVWSFCSAVLLLALLLCAAEVGLRCRRVSETCSSAGPERVHEALLDDVCRPSRTTYLEPIPGKRLLRANPDTGQDIEIRLNDFGLRAPVVSIPKPADVYRVLLLGDDTIFGSEVYTDELVSAQLEQILKSTSPRRIEVLNAAIPGGCPLQAVLWVRHTLLCLQPDLVVHHFDMSDVADDYAMRTFVQGGKDGSPRCAIHPGLQETRTDLARGLREHFLTIEWAELQLAEIWARRSSPRTRSDLGDPLNRYRWLEDTPPDWSIPIQHAIGALGHVRKSLPENVAYVVTTCPKPWQVSEDACPSVEVRVREGVRPRAVYASRRPFELVNDFCREARIPCLVCDDAFRRSQEPERLYLDRSPGLSAEGHALYAQRIAEFVVGQVPGPWSRPHSDGSAGGSEIQRAEWAAPSRD